MTSHRRSRTAEYRIWTQMKTRCSNKSRDDYKRYGARGITVCDRWLKFENFLADLGPRPSDQHTLDRIDNDRGYEPENCRWASRIDQANNKRTNRFIEYRGERMTLANAVRAAGNIVLNATALSRIRSGWEVSDAVETPNVFQRVPLKEKRR